MSNLFKALPPSTKADLEFRRAQIAFAHAVVAYEAELRGGAVAKDVRELQEQVERLERLRQRLGMLQEDLREYSDYLQGNLGFVAHE